MNMARKQRCPAVHMDCGGYKHSCKLLIGHPGDHKCSKFSYSWEDCKRPMNPKPLDASLAERLKEIYLNAAMADGYNVRKGFRAVADYVRKIVKEAKGGRK